MALLLSLFVSSSCLVMWQNDVQPVADRNLWKKQSWQPFLQLTVDLLRIWPMACCRAWWEAKWFSGEMWWDSILGLILQIPIDRFDSFWDPAYMAQQAGAEIPEILEVSLLQQCRWGSQSSLCSNLGSSSARGVFHCNSKNKLTAESYNKLQLSAAATPQQSSYSKSTRHSLLHHFISGHVKSACRSAVGAAGWGSSPVKDNEV